MELLVLGLVATIGLASYALWQKGRTDEPQAPGEERTPSNLQVGDIVQHLGTDYIVEGGLTFAEETAGPAPRLYRLVDGSRARYLYAAAGDPLLLDETNVELASPPSDSVEHDRQHFRIREVLHAMALRTGVVGQRRADGRVTVRSYAAGVMHLVLLEWADHLDAFVGERVAAHLIDVLPAK
jgi:hypothetical protein